VAPVIILKCKMRLIKRVLIIMARVVLVIIIKIITMERILVALEHKEGSKDRYYRLHQQ
jgi:hypothetical protein